MPGKTFLDTNILIYAHDVDAGTKHTTARDVVRDLWTSRSGVLSMQVLQEFYVNATRKMSSPLTREVARSIVNSYAAWCVETGVEEIALAFQIEDQARISFWDALILAAARKTGATRILSEDLNAGQQIAGLTIENPFAPPAVG